jgi:soluble lytic murein transglycosylase-like protein
MAIAMLAASPLRAADVPAAASPAETPGAGGGTSTTFVVRADPRTGKLVRRPVAQQAAKPANPSVAKLPAGVRSEMPAPISAPKISAPIAAMVEQSARTHAVDPLLVQAVIAVESNYNASAVSPKGAEGLMQLMPPTARMLGVANSFDPAQNIEAGVRYLKQLQDLYKDDTLALAAYNAGPKAVEKFKSVPPYRETQNYVDQVGRRYEAARGDRAAAQANPPKQSGAGKSAGKSAVKSMDAPAAPGTPSGLASGVGPVQAAAGEEQHPKLEQLVDQNGRLSLKTSP